MKTLAAFGAAALLLLPLSAAIAGIDTPPDDPRGEYRSLTKGWLQEFNKFRSEQGLPAFVWSERMYTVLLEYTLDLKSKNLGMNQIPGPCERPTERARRVHRWNIGFFDNYTIFLKASYTPQEAVKSVASVSIIKSVRNPAMNAAAVAIVERNETEIYIIMSTAKIDADPVLRAREKVDLFGAILKAPDATPADRLAAIKDIAGARNFELAPVLLEYVRDADPEVAKAACEGLAALGDPSFVYPLIQSFDKARPEAVDAIAAVLAKVTGRKDLGKDAENWRKWYEASGNTLSRPFEAPAEDVKLSDKEIDALVEDFLLEIKNPDSVRRIDAIKQVGRIKHAKIAKAVDGALADKDPIVRRTAAEVLEFQAEKGTLPALVTAAGVFKDDIEFLTAVTRALGAIGDYRALPVVTKDLQRPGQEELTLAKIEALGKIRHQDSIQTLVDFLGKSGRGNRRFGKAVFESLRRLTSQDFGEDQNAWKTWWEGSKATFRFRKEEEKK
ncbi:MAG: HEAT repeat domain-containing protein [Planctomycetes bacterium]|nr:HEAT repeat domain-containing protein [Planctomycetota bacterium]